MPPPNPIVLENKQPGSDGWQLGLSGYQVADDILSQVKGYASATSVNRGENIVFYVTANPAQPFTIDVYRMGWYGGKGARLMAHVGPLDGFTQSECRHDLDTGLVECNWVASYSLHVPGDWVSGIYLALLTNDQRYQNYIVFVVRDDQRVADFLYQQPVTTYQAYNDYPHTTRDPGKSLYESNSYGRRTIARTSRAVKVSFDRPYSVDGCGDFLRWEIYFIRWLEQSGYDVAYSTSLDTHIHGARIRAYRAFLSVGHDEYYSAEMYDAVEAARNAGVSLGFFGANEIYWHIRFEASSTGQPNRVMVCYKDAREDPNPDPRQKTIRWRDQNRPEQRLVGIQYVEGKVPDGIPYLVRNSSNWVYAGTGLRDGDAIPGFIGPEVDRRFAQYPTPTGGDYTLLSQSPFDFGPRSAADFGNSSVYRAPSGAWVFAAGTIRWSWVLDRDGVVDPRMQQVTANVLDRFLAEEQK